MLCSVHIRLHFYVVYDYFSLYIWFFNLCTLQTVLLCSLDLHFLNGIMCYEQNCFVFFI